MDRFYSVLDHSLFCDDVYCNIELDEESTNFDLFRMRALVLLHDAHEAYTGDIIRPMKTKIPNIYDIQDDLDEAILTSFGIEMPTTEEKERIKKIDDIALISEARLFMPLNAYEDICSCVVNWF